MYILLLAVSQEQDKLTSYTPVAITKFEQDYAKLLRKEEDTLKAFENTRDKCCSIPINPAAKEDGEELLAR